MDIKAQGALEYLIIIAAVLAVAAIVVTIVTGVLEGRDVEMLTTEAQESASNCYSTLVANNMDTGTEANLTANEDYCGDICAGDWAEPGSGVGTVDVDEIDLDNDPVNACLAGEPGWIIQEGE